MKTKVTDEKERNASCMIRVRSSRWLGALGRFIECPEKVQTATFWFLIVTLALIVVVAVGQWQIYPRLERIEAILGLRAMQK